MLYRALVNLQKELSEIKQLLTGTRETYRRPSYAASPEAGEDTFAERANAESRHPEGDISEYSSVQFEDAEDTLKKGQSMKDVERNAISRALSSTGGNRRKAAKILGIGERTLYRKINEYGFK
jgi:DNA-binding NtrC family response regulator